MPSRLTDNSEVTDTTACIGWPLHQIALGTGTLSNCRDLSAGITLKPEMVERRCDIRLNQHYDELREFVNCGGWTKPYRPATFKPTIADYG